MNEVTVVKLRLVLDILVSISFMILAILKYRVTLNVSDLILLLGVLEGIVMFYRHASDNIDLFI